MRMEKHIKVTLLALQLFSPKINLGENKQAREIFFSFLSCFAVESEKVLHRLYKRSMQSIDFPRRDFIALRPRAVREEQYSIYFSHFIRFSFSCLAVDVFSSRAVAAREKQNVIYWPQTIVAKHYYNLNSEGARFRKTKNTIAKNLF